LLPAARAPPNAGLFGLEYLQIDLAFLDTDLDHTAFGQLAEEKFFRQWLFDMLLDHPGQRACAHLFVIALVTKPFSGGWGQLERDVSVHELRFKLQHEFLDHAGDDLLAQRGK